MGLLDGKLTGRVLHTAPHREGRAFAVAMLQQRRLELDRRVFRPVDTKLGRFTSCGWCDPNNILAPPPPGDLLLGDMIDPTIILGIRIDEVKLNKRVFEARLKRKLGEESRKRGRKLAKSEIAVEREALILAMAGVQTPQTTVHELAWIVTKGWIVTTATGGRALDQIRELFSETFGVDTAEDGPVAQAAAMADLPGLAEALTQVLPAPFSPFAPAAVATTPQEVSA